MLPLVAVAYVTWWAFLAIRRVYFHPLSTYPGPTIAAATSLYKAYIECIAKISWVDTVEALHASYGKRSPHVLYDADHAGDVVRTGPNEV